MSTQEVKKEKMMLELFIDGCRKGFKIAVEHIMPAMICFCVDPNLTKNRTYDRPRKSNGSSYGPLGAPR